LDNIYKHNIFLFQFNEYTMCTYFSPLTLILLFTSNKKIYYVHANFMRDPPVMKCIVIG
jgi:hypothetical protein